MGLTYTEKKDKGLCVYPGCNNTSVPNQIYCYGHKVVRSISRQHGFYFATFHGYVPGVKGNKISFKDMKRQGVSTDLIEQTENNVQKAIESLSFLMSASPECKKEICKVLRPVERRDYEGTVHGRKGQALFRKSLIAEDKCCVLTGAPFPFCDAAHWNLPGLELVSAGVLLRRDIHRIVDLYPSSLKAQDGKILFQNITGFSYYDDLHDRPLRLSEQKAKKLAEEIRHRNT